MNEDKSSWAFRVLKRFCPDHLVEEIEGDLVQKFQKDIKALGERKANRRLIWNTLRFFRPGIIFRNKFSFQNQRDYMIDNYFKIALRGIMRNKVFSLINISGLAVGTVAFFLIVQYVSFEMSYDQFHGGKEDIYRIGYSRYENGELKNTSAKNLVGLRALLNESFPEVIGFTGFWQIPANADFVFRYDGQVRMEPGEYIFADSNFLKVFPDILLKGNPDRIMDDPHNLIISEKMASKIFGDKDPVGLHIDDIVDPANDGPDLVIAGVMKDFPENAHFHADFLTPMDHQWDTVTFYWDVPSFYTYVKLSKGTDIQAFEERLNRLLADKADEQPTMNGARAFLQPITSIHLNSAIGDELESNGSASLIYVLSFIGLIILVIAWINYINLETAQFLTRAREIGIRRIVGSTKADMALQFLIKYLCINVFSFALAACILYLILPHFSYLTGIPIHTIRWASSLVWLTGFALFFAGSVLVGVYPSLYLTRFNPSEIIKGHTSAPTSGRLLRKSLVTIQFTVSLVLIAFLVVISNQLDFMKLTNKKIGLDQVLAVKNAMAYANDEIDIKRKEFTSLQTKLSQYSSVEMVSSSSAIPGTEIGFTLVNEMKRNEGDPYDPTRFKLLFIDYNFIPLYQLKLKAGRGYSLAIDAGENAGKIILNESAIYALGFMSVEEALGNKVHFPLWPWMKPDSEIIGILEDYHHEAIKKPVMPMIFFLNLGSFQQVYYSIKLHAGSDPVQSLVHIEKGWKEVFPERPFEYFFLDDYYDQQFKSELYFGRIFGLFAGVAVLLACLGILGMTLFEANIRVKEISIRKVLGASIANLLSLLARDHVKVIAISALLSFPLVYFAAAAWLENYPARIDLPVAVYLIPVGAMTVLVVLTSFFQTLKAANTNPLNHLKNE